jgi:FdrA protein
VDRLLVERSTYRDSFTLMTLGRDAQALAGVEEVFAVLATPVNTQLLTARGFSVPNGTVGPDDLIVAVRAEDPLAADAAEALIRQRLATGFAATPDGPAPDLGARNVRTLARRSPDVAVLVVSVPGSHAAYEVAAGLEAGLHVFCFSSGMSLDEERHLKRFAGERGLLLMGPDCGTAIIDGVGFGFANVVRPGPVGIVGASGTGMQEIACMLDGAGLGISQAIGVGSRDLSAEIGGLMTHRAIDLLADDAGTETIVVVSKPPNPAVAAALVQQACVAGKPAVLGLVGSMDTGGEAPSSGSVQLTSTLEDTARRAAALHGRGLADHASPRPPASPGFLRGLFCGGTLCHEAHAAASMLLGPIPSNLASGGRELVDPWRPEGNAFIDFGAEQMTEGRLHPMIDPSVRNEQALRACLDPQVGVVVLDVVLGRAAHRDPARDVAEVTRRARAARGDRITVVVTVCGTDGDPQDLRSQRRELDDAGAILVMGAGRAGRLAAEASRAPGAA